MLTISLHVVDHHGLHVVQDPCVHSDVDGGLDAADTDCLCLLLDGDLCSCGFVDPVESLQTRSNTVGDSLVLLPSCSVNLARLKAPGTRLSRNNVVVHGSSFGFNLDLYVLQVPVKYVSESDGDDKVGLFLASLPAL